ncbi:UNVERIFIED_CONTAM: hypothetical protein K2H54_027225 [Gekko kuhli]
MREPQLKGVAQMNFSLRLLNEDLSVVEEPDIYDEGSPIYIEAMVLTTPGMLFPKIFIDECYGTDTKEQIHPRRLYVLVDNHGCLYSEEADTAASWFRKKDSAIVFTVPAFLVTGEPVEEIYIHCLLTVWSQRIPTSSGKKACYFNRASSSWKNIDEPSKASVCSCCDSSCPMEFSHPGDFKGQCHTMKNMLLVSFAFLASFALMIFFIGGLLVLVIFLSRYILFRKEHRLLVNKMEPDFDTELKTVAGALAAGALEAAEETQESNLDYCKLKGDTPEKA